MKRCIACLAAVIIGSAGASGHQDIRLGGQAGYFQPWGREFRDIYGGGAHLGIEASVDLGSRLMVLVGYGRLGFTGRMSFTGEAVSVGLIPLHLALGWTFSPQKPLSLFVAAGGSLNTFREAAPLGSVERTGLGLGAQIGVLVRLTDRLGLEAKFAHDSLRMKFPESQVDLSGTSGLIGLKFSLSRKTR